MSSPTLLPPSLPSPSPSPSPSSTPFPSLPVPDVDSNSCKLLGPFALVVQLIMGLLVIGSLIYKRHKERPKRKWKIWLLDITKQMLGQLFVHILNIAFSEGGGGVPAPSPKALGVEGGGEAGGGAGKGEGRNPCSLYFLNVLIDTTLGVFIIYTLLSLFTHVLTDIFHLPGFVSGQYTPSTVRSGRGRTARPHVSYWAKQLGVYLFVLLLMKLSVLVILAVFPFLIDMGSWLLKLFGSHKHAQVLFSMALFPLAMNVLQFWLIDSLLRHNPNTSKYAQLPTSNTSSIVDPHPPGDGNGGTRYADHASGHDYDAEHHAGAVHAVGSDSDSDASHSSTSSMRRRGLGGVASNGTAIGKRGGGRGHAYPPPNPVGGEATTSTAVEGGSRARASTRSRSVSPRVGGTRELESVTVQGDEANRDRERDS